MDVRMQQDPDRCFFESHGTRPFLQSHCSCFLSCCASCSRFPAYLHLLQPIRCSKSPSYASKKNVLAQSDEEPHVHRRQPTPQKMGSQFLIHTIVTHASQTALMLYWYPAPCWKLMQHASKLASPVWTLPLGRAADVLPRVEDQKMDVPWLVQRSALPPEHIQASG